MIRPRGQAASDAWFVRLRQRLRLDLNHPTTNTQSKEAVLGNHYGCEVMGEFTREELARRAGVPVEFVDRLVEFRIVSAGEGSSPFIRQMIEHCGALVGGRGEFDKTHGWGGRHPMGAPVFVLTHDPPAEWPFPETPEAEDMPFTYATDGIEWAIAQARA